MARRALASVRAFHELPIVCVLVAIHALCERQRLLEISARVALRAIHADVFTQQRELSFRMIKMLAYAECGDFLPSTRVVASLAALRERSAVRIFMTIGALIKRDSHVLRLPVSSIRMAFRALYLRMHSGQRIPRLRVIELTHVDLLPVHEVMARLTLRPEPPFVLVLVARGACSGEPKVGPIQILLFNQRPFLRRYVRGSVALVACKPGMLALKNVSGVFMIEGLRIPFHQRKIFPVVFRVAACAFLT